LIAERRVLADISSGGFILQLIAAGWHNKTPAQLRELSDKVGPERIMVIHGTRDRMVSFPHGEELLAGLGGEEAGISKIFIDGQGHVIPIEMRHEFNGWVKSMIHKTIEMDENGHPSLAKGQANGHAKGANGSVRKRLNGGLK
jgi:hypothetical protein